MALQITFLISGLAIMLIITTKALSLKNEKDYYLLKLISRGDKNMRDLSHSAAHWYGEGREILLFFVEKQMPLHTKNFLNKSTAVIKERLALLTGDIRNSRLLKKNGGISEYLKKISDKENNASIEPDIEEK